MIGAESVPLVIGDDPGDVVLENARIPESPQVEGIIRQITVALLIVAVALENGPAVKNGLMTDVLFAQFLGGKLSIIDAFQILHPNVAIEKDLARFWPGPGYSPQDLGSQSIPGPKKIEDCPPGLTQTKIHRLIDSGLFLRQKTNRSVMTGHQLRRAIGGVSINDEDFKRDSLLGGDGIQGLTKFRPWISSRNNNGEHRVADCISARGTTPAEAAQNGLQEGHQRRTEWMPSCQKRMVRSARS